MNNVCHAPADPRSSLSAQKTNQTLFHHFPRCMRGAYKHF